MNRRLVLCFLANGAMKEAILFVLTANTCIFAEEYTIQTTLGQIKGLVIQNHNTQKVYQFFRIPFAKPPVGSLRFKKPEPYGAWNGILDATKLPSACMQKTFQISTGSEDCLYLNIYVPNEVSVGKNKTRIWVSNDGSELASAGDVIVVTINNRLNIFGFISSADSKLPGNYGLWDQRLAIQWVKNNIRDYGGNPSSITIFGESAGAVSVGYQSLSPLNSGLFQRAILQSGSPLSKMATIEYGKLDLFAKHAGCYGYVRVYVIKCLQHSSALHLLNVYVNASMENKSLKPIVGGVVDGELLPAKPEILLKDKGSSSYKFFRSLDIIIGSVSMEGSLFLVPLGRNGEQTFQNLTTKLLCDVLSPTISAEFFNHISTISQAICDRYKVQNGDTTMMAEQGRQLLNMYSDLFYISPAVELLHIHSKDNLQRRTYQFLLSYGNDLYRVFPTPDWVQGAHHGSLNVFLFGFKQFAANKSFSVEEYNMSQTILNYWTNFAKTGNPNEDSLISPDWPERYFQLDKNIQSKSHLFNERVRFWSSDIPQLLNPIVMSKSGQIRGVAVPLGDNFFTEFRGIPYAQPPVGKLRFTRPRSVQAWMAYMMKYVFRLLAFRKKIQM
ncbi:hypothetical protein KUTeg_017440 [Tegillarca granosa]|uniref:Carboxylesterase type B domain-containing protein n=1 Tax=Tegillarca granosa TaxID=220873 RepID=A0ABQ9EIU4_TEGGR|nr:hypothetical protein KUTeg_017440 [Tegillarca granosa]